jgi:hypothetical protein
MELFGGLECTGLIEGIDLCSWRYFLVERQIISSSELSLMELSNNIDTSCKFSPCPNRISRYSPFELGLTNLVYSTS